MTSKSRDQLTKATDQGKIELQEQELSRVSGGTENAGAKPHVKLFVRKAGGTQVEY
jgi:hypothetical protein